MLGHISKDSLTTYEENLDTKRFIDTNIFYFIIKLLYSDHGEFL